MVRRGRHPNSHRGLRDPGYKPSKSRARLAKHEESKLQNPPGATTPWGKHHRRESCQVHAHVCQKTCAYASLKALTLYSLYFLNNKNAIKIKEKLVSISGFLFTLKIQGVFLQKHY